MSISPLSARIGAEVTGADVKTLTTANFDALYAAWLDSGVLVIRDQSLDDDALKVFSERFGPLEERPTGEIRQEEKDRLDNLYVTVISNIVENGKRLGALANKEARWHSDMTYRPVPPTASLLYAVELPKPGGDTHFACQYAPFEATPPTLRERLSNVVIKHDASHSSVGDLRRGY